MGSLRNPIGPLPASIYWRRRAVALAVLVLVVVLVVWVLSMGGGGGTHDDGKGGGPASTITPGPTESGPAVTERPGGRDDSGTGATGGAATGGGGADGGSGATAGGSGGSGTGGSGGGGADVSGWHAGDAEAATGGSGGEAGDTGAGGAGGSGGSGGGGGAAAPAVGKLPDCTSSDVSLKLHSVHKSYAPGEKPRFELTVKNDGGACKIDLGRTATVVTVKDADDHTFWASDDCAGDAPAALVRVPAHDESVHTFTWLRQPSPDKCGTPAAGSAAPGHYRIEVDVKGLEKAHAKFELTKD